MSMYSFISSLEDKIMNTKTLPSTQFSQLNAVTKDFINMGEWFLYEISYPKYPEAQYYLSTDAMSFFLSEDGTVVAKTDRTPDDLQLIGQVCFSDLPQANVLVDMELAWA